MSLFNNPVILNIYLLITQHLNYLIDQIIIKSHHHFQLQIQSKFIKLHFYIIPILHQSYISNQQIITTVTTSQ